MGQREFEEGLNEGYSRNNAAWIQRLRNEEAARKERERAEKAALQAPAPEEAPDPQEAEETPPASPEGPSEEEEGRPGLGPWMNPWTRPFVYGVSSFADQVATSVKDVWRWAQGDETKRTEITVMRDLSPDPQGMIEDSFAGVIQFGVGYVPGLGLAAKASKAAGIAAKTAQMTGKKGKLARGAERLGKDIAAGGATDFVAHDPYGFKLVNFLNRNPWADRVIPDVLETNADDGVLEARTKTAVEGGAIGVMAEGAFAVVRSSVRAMRAGAKEQGLDAEAAVEVEDAAQAQAQDATGVAKETVKESETGWKQKKGKEPEEEPAPTTEELAKGANIQAEQEAEKAVRQQAKQSQEQLRRGWSVSQAERAQMHHSESIPAWLASRGVPEEDITRRTELIQQVEKDLAEKVEGERIFKLRGYELDVYLTGEKDSLLGQTMAYTAQRDLGVEETKGLVESLKVYAPRMDPSDVLMILTSLRSRVARQGGKEAADPDAAGKLAAKYTKLTRALQDLHAGFDEPQRMKAALQATDDLLQDWTPELTMGAPIDEILSTTRQTDRIRHPDMDKTHVVRLPQTPEEVRAAEPETMGTNPGDMYWANHRTNRWNDKPVQANILLGADVSPHPDVVLFGTINSANDISDLVTKEMAPEWARGKPPSPTVLPDAPRPATVDTPEDEAAAALSAELGDDFTVTPEMAALRAQAGLGDEAGVRLQQAPGEPAAGARTAEETARIEQPVTNAERFQREAQGRLAVEAVNELLDQSIILPFRIRSAGQGYVTDPRHAQSQLNALLAAGQTAHRLARTAASPHASLVERAGFIEGLYKHEAINAFVAGDHKRVRRLLELSREVMEDPDKAIRQFGGSEKLTAFAAAIDNADTLEDGLRMMRDTKRHDRVVGWARTIQQIRLASLLTSPLTHAKNIVGNMVPPILDIPVQYWTSARGQKAIWNKAIQEDMHARLYGTYQGLLHGWTLMKADLAISRGGVGNIPLVQKKLRAQNLDILRRQFSRVTKLDRAQGVSEDAAARELNANLRQHEWVTQGERWRAYSTNTRRFLQDSRFFNTSFDYLQAEDMMFKSVSYMAELHVQALKQGRLAGKHGPALKQHVADALKNHRPDDNLGKISLAKAELNTFTNELDTFGQSVQSMLNMGGQAGRWVVPYPRTTMNLFKFAARHFPGTNLFVKEVKKNLKAGGEARHQEEMRMMLGTAIAGMAGTAMWHGNLTGGGVPGMKYAEPRYSFRLAGTDTWMSYAELPMLGPILRVVADTVEGVNAADPENKDEVEAASAILALGGAMIGAMIDEVGWAGDVGEFLEMINTGGAGMDDRMIGWASRQATSAIPYSALRRDTAKYLFGGSREDTRTEGGFTYGAEEGLERLLEQWERTKKDAFPMIRMMAGDERYPKLNLYGELETNAYPPDASYEGRKISFGRIASAARPLLTGVAAKTDPLSVELNRMGVGFHNPRRVRQFSDLGYTGKFEYNEQQAWEFAQRRGRLFFRYATEEVGSSAYKEAADPWRVHKLRQAMARATGDAEDWLDNRYPEIDTAKQRFSQRVLLDMRRKRGEQ